MKTDYKITPLEREIWQGHKLEFRYTSSSYYEVKIESSPAGFNVSFIKTPFDVPFKKQPDDSDKLFQPWWERVQAWGIVENNYLLAAIETAVEDWQNRLIVTELWVHDDCRRQGIATALMDTALKRAKEENRRTVALETQSCNEGAIDFYLNYGFSLIGFDACAYSNKDLERKEVRMEMGILLR